MCLCVSLCVCSVNKDGGQSDPHRQEVRDVDLGHIKSTPNIQLEAAAAAVGGGAAAAAASLLHCQQQSHQETGSDFLLSCTTIGRPLVQ